jgi:alkanesulfonate monooxygenase SsuD/methylene tetrahydromethanopterin reductase-like flavin-dependent oxidoreductase (luciferase family)
MKAWYFCEMSYHPAWIKTDGPLRNTLPSAVYDPVEGSALYNRLLDEYALCDDLGINLMFNEHHSTATCLNAICTIPLAIMARETKRARLLALGMQLANRPDPVRVAEEFAMIDVISGGRVEMGFVKGSPQEVFPNNSNPVDMMERFWESHDLIVKAMSTHDGPFIWEGRHFHHRSVNIWPRPVQSPHPPIWITGGSESTASAVAKKGYVLATLNTGFALTRSLFDAYRQSAAPGIRTEDKLAYLALLSLGHNKEEAFRRADQVLDYVRNSGRVAPHFTNPPGYSPVSANVAAIRAGITGGLGSHQQVRSRSGERLSRNDLTVENMIDAGVMFAGTPDMVCRQIEAFRTHVGGFNHLMFMSQAGWMSHADAVANITLFGKEVLPRIGSIGG